MLTMLPYATEEQDSKALVEAPGGKLDTRDGTEISGADGNG